jgi:hypothetical protein
VDSKPLAGLSRERLLDLLDAYNASLARQYVAPRITADEAQSLDLDELADMVHLTGVRLRAVIRALGGIP